MCEEEPVPGFGSLLRRNVYVDSTRAFPTAGETSGKFSSLMDSDFSAVSVGIVDRARDAGIPLRILGAMAVYVHSAHVPQALARYRELARLGQGKPMFTDLDLMGYSKQRKEVASLFEKSLAYKPEFFVNSLFGGRRNIYHHPEGKFDVDIFYDALSFSHEVKFGETPGKGRLELDYPTISLADIVLEKLQIHQINRKDLVDLFTLLVGHDIGRAEPETVDGEYVSSVLSDDWGFEYDARSNLDKLREFSRGSLQAGSIAEAEWRVVDDRVAKLLHYVDTKPKSKDWQKRAKKGTSKPWYNEVEEVQR